MGVKLQDIDETSISRSFTPVYILKHYSRLNAEALLPSISRSFTLVYILKLYSRLYPEALPPSISLSFTQLRDIDGSNASGYRRE
jgi:hypothetical protein